MFLLSDLVNRDFLSCPGVHGILCDTSLQLLELGLDLLTFGLLLVELGLEFSGHLVIAILSLLQIEANLMHVGKSIQVFVFVHLLSISLGMGVTSRLVSLLLINAGIHKHDLPLQLFIVAF